MYHDAYTLQQVETEHLSSFNFAAGMVPFLLNLIQDVSQPLSVWQYVFLRFFGNENKRFYVFLNDMSIRYDTIGEFNVDSKAECDQLNLAHETKTNKHISEFQSDYFTDLGWPSSPLSSVFNTCKCIKSRVLYGALWNNVD